MDDATEGRMAREGGAIQATDKAFPTVGAYRSSLIYRFTDSLIHRFTIWTRLGK